MPANKQNDPNFFSGVGINEIEYDILGNPTGVMPVRPISQTQSTPPNTAGTAGKIPANGNPAAAASLKGVGAPTDDNVTAPGDFTAQIVPTYGTNGISGGATVPQANVLDQYASYTYSLSWYMLSPEQYTAMQTTHRITPNEWSLLAQSGGASIQSGDANGTRNKYFMLDYYLDNLVISSAVMTRATQANELSFDITEPNGMTLLANLQRAANDILNLSGPNNGLQVIQYCMVIRFYGYDVQGNLITKVGNTTGTPGASPTSSNAVVVKYFPFIIVELTFSAANKAVVYHVKGNPCNYNYASGSQLGSIPFAFELSGQTVSDILCGQPINTKAPATDGRTPIPISTGIPGIRVGTPGAANQDQADILSLIAAGNMGA
jgi:hypothetical protein